MQLRIVQPAGLFADIANVDRVVAMTPAGSFGLLPQRLDCAAVLQSGILTYSSATTGEVHVAVDAGVLVKTGSEVLVCVRRAIAGADLGRLHEAIQQQLLRVSEQEGKDRRTLAHLEVGLMHEFARFHHD